MSGAPREDRPSRTVSIEDVEAARAAIHGHVRRTPCERSRTLSDIFGADVWLKFENFQFTASFKERGALNRLLRLDGDERRRGVIAMSAGNHAQAVACHGQRLGIPTTIVMPRTTPNNKVRQTRVFGAEVILHGNVFDETRAFAEAHGRAHGLRMIHPFDDPAIIAGQGTVGLEIAEQVPDVDAVIVPIGGGGLISGVATALEARCPRATVHGVQTERFAPVYRYFGGASEEHLPSTVAEGIAVKVPGAATMRIIEDLVDDVVAVGEADIEQAIFMLLEIEKTVCEGAGAASLAALGKARERFAGRRVVLILSGGNIDMMVLSSVILRGLGRTSRLVRLGIEAPDAPGTLAGITRVLEEMQSNIVDIEHRRAFGTSSVKQVTIELLLEMRGEEQVAEVTERLAAEGYGARRLP